MVVVGDGRRAEPGRAGRDGARRGWGRGAVTVRGKTTHSRPVPPTLFLSTPATSLCPSLPPPHSMTTTCAPLPPPSARLTPSQLGTTSARLTKPLDDSLANRPTTSPLPPPPSLLCAHAAPHLSKSQRGPIPRMGVIEGGRGVRQAGFFPGAEARSSLGRGSEGLR